MPLLEAKKISRDFGSAPLFSDLDFSIEPGEKLALIGLNGCGKTTLIKILLGLDDDFRGTVIRQPGLRTGYVPQKIPADELDQTALSYVLADIHSMRDTLEKYAEAMADPDHGKAARAMDDYSRLRELYDAQDGDNAEERANRLLERAGLSGLADNLVSSLSGGEQNVLALLKAMQGQPDLLVLDEPGNHLDVHGLAWLEDFLNDLACALLLVSHDRRMLDKVASSILELDKGRLTRYTGNYSAYRLAKLRAAASQGQAWQADRVRVERLEALVKKFEQIARARPDPSWGKRLRARRHQLERVKTQAAERPDLGRAGSTLSFSAEASRADLALALSSYRKSYGQRQLITDSSFTILNGERVAIVGPNGSGKTSFLRDLMELGSWDNPVIRVGPSMILGYCAQDQSLFSGESSLEDEFVKILPTAEDVRKHLSGFGFGYQDLQKSISRLSGGELNRLQLARASAIKANFLVLDEPTNHLDIATRESIEEALDAFEGTILLVSHDRYFMDKVADRVVFIDENRFVEYEGSFAEWWRDLGRPRLQNSGSASAGLADRSRKLRSGKIRSSPQSSGNADKSSAGLEEKIASMERERESLERSIAHAIEKRRFAEAKELSSRLEAHSRDLDALWEKLAGLMG